MHENHGFLYLSARRENRVTISLFKHTRSIFVTATVAFLLAAGAMSIFLPVSAAESASLPSMMTGPLDGRTFSARIVRPGEAEKGPLEDKLTFSDGMFSSAICERYNFKGEPYWVRGEGDAIHFYAELNSPTDGKMLWKGTVRGNLLEGTMRWTRKRWYWTIDAEHTIQGELEEVPSGAKTPP